MSVSSSPISNDSIERLIVTTQLPMSIGSWLMGLLSEMFIKHTHQLVFFFNIKIKLYIFFQPPLHSSINQVTTFSFLFFFSYKFFIHKHIVGDKCKKKKKSPQKNTLVSILYIILAQSTLYNVHTNKRVTLTESMQKNNNKKKTAKCIKLFLLI